MTHTPLHLIAENQSLSTAGRVRESEHGLRIFNAFCDFELLVLPDDSRPDRASLHGALVRVGGHRQHDTVVASKLDVVRRPQVSPPRLAKPRTPSVGTALRARGEMHRQIRQFFASRDFLEVTTPAITPAPGTDPHLTPTAVDLGIDEFGDGEDSQTYLHTSPELAMKRLLSVGAGPIYQLARVWRGAEVTPLHTPEFSLLEWYRPWCDIDDIMADVETLVAHILSPRSPRPVSQPIRRMTMRQLVDQACGFDLLETLDTASLRDAIKRHELLSARAIEGADWDELFYSLTVSHLDPFLRSQGAIFITHWPHRLAVLARLCDDDPRTAERFELYIDGVELANGFGELTDPVEQQKRFNADNEVRHRLGAPKLPIPEAFLRALKWGMPPSAGVALGVDRLLMLTVDGATALHDIAPLALTRDEQGVHWS